MGPFTIKVGDTRPSLAVDLSKLAATITGATARLKCRPESGGALKVDALGVLALDADGNPFFTYDWQAADTDVENRLRSEIIVTYADTTKETFPSDGFFYVNVTARV